jgi:hypothetical protein
MYNKYLATYTFYGEDKLTIFCFDMDWAILPKRIPKRAKNVSKGKQ